MKVIFSFPESQSQTLYLYIEHWAARTKTSVSGEQIAMEEALWQVA